MSKLFLNIPSSIYKITFESLLSDINKILEIPHVIYNKSIYDNYLNVIASILNSSSVVLLDGDLTNYEIEELGIRSNELLVRYKRNYEPIVDLVDLKKRLINNSWLCTLFTSGTTGKPKRISHNIDIFFRSVMQGDKYEKNIWGLCYHPLHIAGLSVFFQALFNLNTIVYLFDLNRTEINESIKLNNITHLSGTPSFFRNLLPNNNIFTSVTNISSGGERFDASLIEQLKLLFPNAKFRNIYASTEIGSLFVSDGDVFTVKETIKPFVKIETNKLFVHKSYFNGDKLLADEWYDTGDIVEILSMDPLKIKVISRKNDFVNVGGFKVNPLEVEDLLKEHPSIQLVHVFGKKNSVLGNILVAEIVVKDNSTLLESEIKTFLQDKVQGYKVPRLIKFVKEIEMTNTGKIKR